ncbi:hypothetical protein HD554DRAFT_723442 [Boletus coccyginus]|nr:hypothetical protein HD554DRAFT_723442 [Boletus coccyginus]
MFGKLICVAALTSAVLAQGINFTVPAAGSTVTAGSAITVEVERPGPSTAIEVVAVAIGASESACAGGCINGGLGAILYTGIFDPKSTNSEGNAFQNITVTAPNWFNGLAELNIAFFCLLGATIHTPELQFTNTTKFTIIGATG